jgi:hypothetical protein
VLAFKIVIGPAVNGLSGANLPAHNTIRNSTGHGGTHGTLNPFLVPSLAPFISIHEISPVTEERAAAATRPLTSPDCAADRDKRVRPRKAPSQWPQPPPQPASPPSRQRSAKAPPPQTRSSLSLSRGRLPLPPSTETVCRQAQSGSISTRTNRSVCPIFSRIVYRFVARGRDGMSITNANLEHRLGCMDTTYHRSHIHRALLFYTTVSNWKE